MSDQPGLGRRIWNGYHKRELAAARWLWHEIKTRDDAERAVQYGQSAAFYAILIRVVFVLFPGNTDDMDGHAAACSLASRRPPRIPITKHRTTYKQRRTWTKVPPPVSRGSTMLSTTKTTRQSSVSCHFSKPLK